MSAASSGVVEVVEAILLTGPAVNARDEYGWTALHYAAGYDGGRYSDAPPQSRARVIELLLAAGADVNARTDAGDTPLMVAEYHDDAAPALIKGGAK